MKAFLNLSLPSLCRTLPTKRRSEASNVKSSWGSLFPEVFMFPAARSTRQVALVAEIFLLEKSQRPFFFFKSCCLSPTAAARVGNEEPPARCGAHRGQNGRTVPERRKRRLWRPPGPSPAQQGHPEHGAQDGARVPPEGEAPSPSAPRCPRVQPNPPGLGSRGPPAAHLPEPGGDAPRPALPAGLAGAAAGDAEDARRLRRLPRPALPHRPHRAKDGPRADGVTARARAGEALTSRRRDSPPRPAPPSIKQGGWASGVWRGCGGMLGSGIKGIK